ncbi:MAG: alanine--tRNA ligase [bacterium]
MKGNELRQRYLDFFARKGHLVLPSASLVPQNDPSLLLIGAGMAPFKPYFTGQETPPRQRIATCQKCVRTGDLENVGRTARHHTFFEMLGNFSFADYFKAEAIAWAWEFITQELGIAVERLWVSIYEEDEEAFFIWRDQVGIAPDRIVKLGKEDNFWEIGTGPCGPCSEIYVDLEPERGCGRPNCAPGCDCDRYLEVWNLVFTQFNKDENGNYNPLPKKNIDTGMGLERIAAVMQGVPTNYDTDLILPIIKKTAHLAGVAYQEQEKIDVSLKVIADHLRAVVHLVGDGVLPSNEGRGYVLRRLLRRAIRHGKLIGLETAFSSVIAEEVIALGQGAYPDLLAKKEAILQVIQSEEQRFQETLQAGINILTSFIAELKQKGENVLVGEQAFQLYDTYGFPLDLTREIVAEEGLIVDEKGFQKAMAKQRERARAARREDDGMLVGTGAYRELVAEDATGFTGYESLQGSSTVKHILKDNAFINQATAGDQVEIILAQTPFYAEAGGQVGDRGLLVGSDFEVKVLDTRILPGGIIAHKGVVERGVIKKGSSVDAQVDVKRRIATARNHTATHILHWALRQVVGKHVEQGGSLVTPERLRFDFTHFAALSPARLNQIEHLVNGKILENISLEIFSSTLATAQRMGATALFGEKYGNEVRVVKIGDYSMELCGGTHVPATGTIGLFKIVSESSIGAGLRRIEAVTGTGALEYVAKLENILGAASEQLKTTPDLLLDRLALMNTELRKQEKEIEELKQKLAIVQVSDILTKAVEIEGVSVLATSVSVGTMHDLRSMVDILKGELPSGVIILGAHIQDKVNFICYVSPDLVKRNIHAGKIVQAVSRIVGGGGGGRPGLAQAGGKDPERLQEALDHGVTIIKQQLAQ